MFGSIRLAAIVAAQSEELDRSRVSDKYFDQLVVIQIVAKESNC